MQLNKSLFIRRRNTF